MAALGVHYPKVFKNIMRLVNMDKRDLMIYFWR